MPIHVVFQGIYSTFCGTSEGWVRTQCGGGKGRVRTARSYISDITRGDRSVLSRLYPSRRRAPYLESSIQIYRAQFNSLPTPRIMSSSPQCFHYVIGLFLHSFQWDYHFLLRPSISPGRTEWFTPVSNYLVGHYPLVRTSYSLGAPPGDQDDLTVRGFRAVEKRNKIPRTGIRAQIEKSGSSERWKAANMTNGLIDQFVNVGIWNGARALSASRSRPLVYSGVALLVLYPTCL